MQDSSPRSDICPHFGTADDPSTYVAYPSPFGRCYRVAETGAVALAHQSRVCLMARHAECVVFKSAGMNRLPPGIAPRPLPYLTRLRRHAGRWLLVVLVLLAAVCGAAWWFLTPLAAPTVPMATARGDASPPTLVTPTAAPSATRSPTPSPTETPTAPPTATLAAAPTAGPELDTPSPGVGSFLIHLLQPGESLIFLADRYGTDAAAIIAANGLNDQPLWEGSYVVIPLGNPDPATLPRFAVYRVPAGGEVLTVLAERYGADPQAIRAYNQLGPSDELPEGRWLILPLP